MKHYAVVIVASLFAVIVFTQCTKRDSGKIFNANFYTTNATGRLTLYVDDIDKGMLPYFALAPQCGAEYADGIKPLNLQLKSGKYKIVGKNEAGQVISSGIIQIGSDQMSSSGSLGGQSVANSGDCLAIGLWE